jgi:TPR repeat protein
MLEAGDGVEKDLIEAAKWALLAATAGSPDAPPFIAKISAVMTDEQKATAEARANEWLAAYRANHPD